MTRNSNNKQIAKNAILLYVRMFLSLIVSLYTSRVILKTLGVEDYGVYSIIGGIVTMFSFLNTAMAGATSRFLTYEMGKGDMNKLKDTFSTSLMVHFSIAILIFVIAETIGIWIVHTQLILPEGRMFAANIVFQCSILSMFITITQVPFSAVVIAHERMGVYAYFELLHVFLKLLVVYILLIGTFDKLILYAILMSAVSLLMALLYFSYCTSQFTESHFRFVLRKDLIKPMLNFSGWNLLSECGYSFRVYGSNIVLNTFFGTVVNAAGGIATTVQGTLLGFVANVVTAVRPQIIKNYSQGNFARMNTLITSSIRLNLFLASLITIPLFVDAPFVLQLWLGEIPLYCIQFCRLLLFTIFITTVSQIVTIGIHASGNIKTTSILRSSIYILTPFAIYAYMKWFNTDPVWGYVIIVISQMIVCLADIYILHRIISYIKSIPIFIDYIKSVVGFVLVYLAIKHMRTSFSIPFIQFVINCIEEWLLISFFYWFLVYKTRERDLMKQAVQKCIHRIMK